MADLLSRLRVLSDKLRNAWEHASDAADQDIADTIDRAVAQYGWHPVSERPTEPSEYFVTVRIRLDGKDCYERSTRFFNGKTFFDAGSIVAWMPMPDTYEPEVTPEPHDPDRVIRDECPDCDYGAISCLRRCLHPGAPNNGYIVTADYNVFVSSFCPLRRLDKNQGG